MNYYALFIQASVLSTFIDQHKLAFYAGELGLAMAVICGIGIMQVQAKNPNRPEWYYFVSVWAISVGAAYMFSTAIDPHVHQHLPDRANWFRFGLGIERLLVMVNYYRLRHGTASRFSEAWTLRINAVLGFVTITFLVIVFGGYMWGMERENVQTNPEDGKILRQNTGRIIGIVEVLKKQATSDSLEKIQLRAEIAANQAKLDKTNAQLSDLIDVVISLKRTINRFGVTVERSRRSVAAPAPIQRQTSGAMIPTDRVKTPPPSTFDRKGRPIGFNEPHKPADSLYYAHQKP